MQESCQCPSLIFNPVLRRLSRLYSHSLKFLSARCELWGHLWLPQRSESPPFCVRTMGPETGNNPGGWPVTSAYDIMIHFGGYCTLYSRRGQNAQRRTFMTRQLFTTNRVSYEFNIFLTSDYKKRWWDISNAEHWILKLQSWFLVSLVERALNFHSFQEQVIMLSVKSLSWIINFECWNVKLKVKCYIKLNVSRSSWMLRTQVVFWRGLNTTQVTPNL